MHQRQDGPSRLISVGACFMAAVGGFLFGYDIGVISGALLSIEREFQTTDFVAELITAGVLVGAMIGAAIGGILADRLGRRRSNMAAGVIFAAGAVFLGFVPDTGWLIAGRVLIGIGVGIASVVGPLYISETSPAEKRGGRVSLFQFAIVFGILAAYVVDAFFTGVPDGWRWMFALGGIPGVLLFLGFIGMPASPRWLVMKHRTDEAEKVLRSLVPADRVAEEIGRIKQDVDRASAGGRVKLADVPGIRLALTVAVGLAILQQFIGINTILFYAPILFHHAGFKTDSAAIAATVGLGLVNLLATLIALRSADRAGRRPLLLWGTAGMTLSLAVIAVGFAIMGDADPATSVSKAPHTGHTPAAASRHLAKVDSSTPADAATTTTSASDLQSETSAATEATDIETTISLLAIVILVFTALFVACFAFSLGPITWTMISEIFPNEVRDRCVSIAAGVNWGSNFVISLTFLTLLDLFGPSLTFSAYGLIGVVGFLWIWRVIPETKGYTLEEIEENLGRGNRQKWLPPAVRTNSPGPADSA